MTAKSIACVIPTFNDAPALHKALLSVCTQIYPPSEVIVLDDCSTDGTADVVRRYQEAYPFVRSIVYPEKSNNWKRDAVRNALNLTTAEYIHSLSANDTIEQHFYAAAQLVRSEGVIFAEFAIKEGAHPLCKPCGIVWMGAQAEPCPKCGAKLTQTPERVMPAQCEMLPGTEEYSRKELLQQLCRQQFFEGGPAALVRRDVLTWLAERSFWEMETWNDSIGYSVAAWLFGAAYVPFHCGTFTFDPASDGEKKKNDAAWALPMYRAVQQFLCGCGHSLPMELRRALQRKAYGALPRLFRAAEMAQAEFAYPTPAASVTVGEIASLSGAPSVITLATAPEITAPIAASE